MDIAGILPQFTQIVIATALGGLLGIERVMRGKDAGIRTSGMISAGACLFTVLSIESGGDPSRIASGIVTGVGFIGAGVLLKDNQTIKGLTTAAYIWIVAGIGMTVGMHMTGLAILLTIFILCLLIFLKPVSDFFHQLGKKLHTREEERD